MQIKNYLFFCLYVLLNPTALLLLFKKIYLPVYVQYQWLKKYDINTFIDIGANRGDVSQVLHFLFPNAMIYAFEPIQEESNKIRSKVRHTNLIIENSALSNKIGKTSFFVNDFSPASSILSISKECIQDCNKMSRIKKIEVLTTTLDTFFRNKNLKKDVFLKIDTQGSEKLILEGGKDVLQKVAIIHIEICFSHLYKNQTNFEEIYKILTNAGFNFIGSILESDFYPFFGPRKFENYIFLRR